MFLLNGLVLMTGMNCIKITICAFAIGGCHPAILWNRGVPRADSLD